MWNHKVPWSGILDWREKDVAGPDFHIPVYSSGG